MRVIISLLLLFCAIKPALPQTPANKTVKPVKTEMPSKTEIQSQMNEATNEIRKEIADLEKQIASSTDAEEIKDLKEQVAMLKKQLTMMEGLNKSVSGMSEKVFKEAAAEEKAPLVPKRDSVRIRAIPKKTLSEAELLLFVKKVHGQVENSIPAVEKTPALKIYNETKSKYKSAAVVANAASGCWMLGHWEKALYIMGKVCIDDMSDADNLNNYAAFLVMTGGEQAAIPILEYLNEKYPGNSTILNNMGQAWFGLGDMTNAKKYLNDATSIYGNHSQANGTLVGIYESEGNNEQAIGALKKAIKETYDPEKEHELNRLGINLVYADLPEFNYPMKEDPIGLIPLINTLPENYPSAIGDDQSVDAIDRYLNGVRKLKEELSEEGEMLGNKVEAETKKLVLDHQYNFDYVEAHNTPAYKLAKRSLDLLIAERLQGASPLPAQLLAGRFLPFGANEKVKTHWEILRDCQKIWQDSVVEAIAALSLAMRSGNRENPTCSEVDAVTNAYVAKKQQIYRNGTRLIKQLVTRNKKQLTTWSKIYLNGTMDKPPTNTNDLTSLVIGNAEYTTNRKRLRNVELDAFLGLAESIVNRQEFIKSSCDPSSDNKSHTEDADDLAWLKKDLDCEFKKVVNVPVLVYTFTCNTKKEESKGLDKRKPDVPKGAASNSKRTGQTRSTGPHGSSKRGPLFFFNESDEPRLAANQTGPLNAENQDPSQFSIEYDKWGNVIDIRFQVNEDGTGLADPDSMETKIDSRWSWNAIASPKKGFMNKLLVK
jgi:tetratricopeptide (TPR) repeat protein